MRTPKTSRSLSLTVAASLIAMAVSGCTSLFEVGDDCPEEPRAPGQGDRPYAGWELSVLSHGAWSYTYSLIKGGFENRTGATLTEIPADDAGTALQEAILNKGNPVADVLWGVDNALLHKARQEGVFEPYTSPEADALLDYLNLDQFRNEEGDYVATPSTQGYINVNYDIALRDEYADDELPKTLRDLATPQWASEFVTEDPRTSSPGLGFLIASVATFGETGPYTYEDYWRDLFSNGVLITSGWTEAYTIHYSANGFGEEGASLDRAIVTSYTTSPAAEVYYESFDEVNAVSLEPANGVFHQIETVGILRCTTNLHLAQEFVDYVLTPEFQQVIPDSQAIYPVIEDLEMPQTYRDLATDPEALDPADFTAEELGEGIPRWVETWEGLFQEHYA